MNIGIGKTWVRLPAGPVLRIMVRNTIITNAIRTAAKKGYVVSPNGDVISPRGTSRKLIPSAGPGDKRVPYLRFNVVDDRGKRVPIPVHMLCAFQKFGDTAFTGNTQIRHKDGNSLNNSENNIILGTKSDNEMDKSKDVRVRAAAEASKNLRALSSAQMDELLLLRKEGWTYKWLADYFNIAVSTAHRAVLKGYINL